MYLNNNFDFKRDHKQVFTPQHFAPLYDHNIILRKKVKITKFAKVSLAKVSPIKMRLG